MTRQFVKSSDNVSVRFSFFEINIVNDSINIYVSQSYPLPLPLKKRIVWKKPSYNKPHRTPIFFGAH